MEDSSTKINLLVGFSGSIATIKDVEIISNLKNTEKFNLRAIYTDGGLKFTDEQRMNEIKEMGCEVYTNKDENSWKVRGDPVTHIELRKWANAILIAPLSANTLAKIAGGLSDNLLVVFCL